MIWGRRESLNWNKDIFCFLLVLHKKSKLFSGREGSEVLQCREELTQKPTAGFGMNGGEPVIGVQVGM